MAKFPFTGCRLIQVKITEKDKHRTNTGWPRPLNRGGFLTQVTNTEFVWAKSREFENLIEDDRLIQGRYMQVRLYTLSIHI